MQRPRAGPGVSIRERNLHCYKNLTAFWVNGKTLITGQD